MTAKIISIFIAVILTGVVTLTRANTPLSDLLEMSEQLDRVDKIDFGDLLKKADSCTAKRDFGCANANIEKAVKLAKNTSDNQSVEASRQKIIAEKSLIAKEGREKERIRIAQEERRRREEEQARRVAESSYNSSGNNNDNWGDYFRNQQRRNMAVLDPLNKQQQRVDDLRRQEYARRQAQEQERRERLQAEARERERQRQRQAQSEASKQQQRVDDLKRQEYARQPAQEQERREQQAKRDAKDRAEKIEREQPL